MISTATFLAGSLLTILVPVLLLLALVAWYDLIFRRHGDPADASDLGRSGAEASAAGGARPGEPVAGAASQHPGGTVSAREDGPTSW